MPDDRNADERSNIPERLVWLWEEAKEEGWLEPFNTTQELIAQLETLESADREYREREARELLLNPTAGMAPDELWEYEQQQARVESVTREDVAMPDDRYTVVRNGQFYTTDKHTIEALRLIREWPNTAEEFFQRGLTEGRIVPGPIRAQGQTVEHVIAEVDPAQPGQGQYVATTRARTNSNGQGF